MRSYGKKIKLIRKLLGQRSGMHGKPNNTTITSKLLAVNTQTHIAPCTQPSHHGILIGCASNKAFKAWRCSARVASSSHRWEHLSHQDEPAAVTGHWISVLVGLVLRWLTCSVYGIVSGRFGTVYTCEYDKSERKCLTCNCNTSGIY